MAAPVEVIGGVAGATQADLHHAFAVEQAFFLGATDRRAVGDGLAEHVVVDVGVGIDVDQADRAMLLGDGTQHRQGDGVIAAQRQRYAVVAQHLIVELLDDVHALGQVEGVDRHIADVRHLQAIEGRGAGGHVVGAQHA